MTLETSLLIKTETKKLIPLIEAYIAIGCIKDELLTALVVILKNVASNSRDCVGWTHKGETEELRNVSRFLQYLKEYEKDYHFVVYICKEWLMFYHGALMSEPEDSSELSM